MFDLVFSMPPVPLPCEGVTVTSGPGPLWCRHHTFQRAGSGRPNPGCGLEHRTAGRHQPRLEGSGGHRLAETQPPARRDPGLKRFRLPARPNPGSRPVPLPPGDSSSSLPQDCRGSELQGLPAVRRQPSHRPGGGPAARAVPELVRLPACHRPAPAHAGEFQRVRPHVRL